MIFTTKSLIFSCIGATIGAIFYLIFLNLLDSKFVGLIAILIFAAIGYGIANLKVPESNNFEITRKTGGEKIDDIIIRAIKFKLRGKRIYLYTKEENK